MDTEVSPHGLHVSAILSVAGFSTIIHIKGPGKTPNILFDCGSIVPSTISAKHVFISHGHCDHIGATVQHARASFSGQSNSTYYVPPQCTSLLEDAKKAFETLDNGEISMDIQPMQPGDAVNIGSGFRVLAFPTTHRVQSQGYFIVHSYDKLFPQYAGLDGTSLRRLRKNGIVINEKIETYELAYTGDTTIEALLDPSMEFLFRIPILLIEMTYIDGDRSKAREWGHIHIDDFIEHIELFQNPCIIFLHLSNKYQGDARSYRPHDRILSILRSKIPRGMHARIGVALKSFGATEYITPLLNRRSRNEEIEEGRPAQRQRQEDRGEGRRRRTSTLCTPCNRR